MSIIQSLLDIRKQEKEKEKIKNISKSLSWHEYFMSTAILISMRSKDPNTQVGACVVRDNIILGTGYNGFPRGIIDTPERWQKPEKYNWVQHAERNCIDNSIKDLTDATIYATLFPCNECMKTIIQKGITTVIYLDYNKDAKSNEYTKTMAKEAGISMIEYNILS